MKVGVIGSGVVAQTLGAGFLKHGHEVAMGTRDPAKLEDGRRKIGALRSSLSRNIRRLRRRRGAGGRRRSRARRLEAGRRRSPIGAGPPVDGVLSFFTTLKDSLMERLQKAYPSAHFVKAFNSVGNAQMVNPHFAGGRPTMFICGNNDNAKRVVRQILDQFGWDTEDMGAVEAIEPLCMLWCIPGVGRGDWSPHAFKLLR